MNTKRKVPITHEDLSNQGNCGKNVSWPRKILDSFYIFILTIDLVAIRNTMAARKLMIITSILVNPFT